MNDMPQHPVSMVSINSLQLAWLVLIVRGNFRGCSFQNQTKDTSSSRRRIFRQKFHEAQAYVTKAMEIFDLNANSYRMFYVYSVIGLSLEVMMCSGFTFNVMTAMKFQIEASVHGSYMVTFIMLVNVNCPLHLHIDDKQLICIIIQTKSSIACNS